MTKIEQATEKLFNAIYSESFCLFHWRGVYSPEKNLKFHMGDNQYYFEESKGLKNFESPFYVPFGLPADEWFMPDYDRGDVLFTANIAIFHKGYVKYIIDVVDSFHVNYDKVDFLYYHLRDVEYIQVEAECILHHEDMFKVDFKMGAFQTRKFDSYHLIDVR